MDFKQLEYFVRVAELGSFTRASRALGVAQSALSRQVRYLEVALRQNLLIRNGRGVTTTDAGRLLLDHGLLILRQVKRAHEDLGRKGGALAGHVAIGLPPSVAKVITVALYREFRKRLPNATLSVSEGLSVSMLEWLLTGRLDIALLQSPQPSPNIETIPLVKMDFCLISAATRKSREVPINLKEVAPLPLIIGSRPNALRMLVETQMAAIGCKPNIALEIDGVSLVLDLVADGAGYAILPRNVISSFGDANTFLVRSIVKPTLSSRLTIATSSKRMTTLTQQAALELIRDVAVSAFEGNAKRHA